MTVDRCLACNAELPPRKAASGSPRRYCSATCRQAAWRRRRVVRDTLHVADELDGLIAQAFVKADPIDATAECVITLRALARRCRALAVDTPAQLSWRHEETAAALADILERLWPV